MRKYVYILIILSVAALLLWQYSQSNFRKPLPEPQTANEPRSFEECVKEGNGVFESHPPTCITKSRKVFTQKPSLTPETVNKIKVNSPRVDQIIQSPLLVTGEARGGWYFEGEFSAKLFDETGNPVGTGIMTAKGEWMSEDYVPFSGQIKFVKPQSRSGLLILEKSNPSGIPENDERFTVKVRFE